MKRKKKPKMQNNSWFFFHYILFVCFLFCIISRKINFIECSISAKDTTSPPWLKLQNTKHKTLERNPISLVLQIWISRTQSTFVSIFLNLGNYDAIDFISYFLLGIWMTKCLWGFGKTRNQLQILFLWY